LSASATARAQERPDEASRADVAAGPVVPAPGSPETRLLAFISDLHLGLGRQANGKWSPKEDFRWPKALAGFLNELRKRGADRVDLIIVGDFLELWQPPDNVKCEGLDADSGCTVSEMVTIVETVIAAHPQEFALLREFSLQGENRIHIVPGNHDSALVLRPVWNPVAVALNAESGRVSLVSTGVWISTDGYILAEHGHQIGSDVNRYPDWPRITGESGGKTYLVRPWGERFVQRLFNFQEEEYEIIDNIAPETVGLKYRIADRGLFKTMADVARFIAFNLFETSFAQKERGLGHSVAAEGENDWDLNIAREEISYRLFLEALDSEDPLRIEIEANQELRTQLSVLARDQANLPDDDVRALCDWLALRDRPEQCKRSTAGAGLEANFIPRRDVIRTHLAERLRNDDRMGIFIYSHTHAPEVGWPIAGVLVHNTGAFQRTIDEKGFLTRVDEKHIPANQALRMIKLEDLPACYATVLVTYQSGSPESKTLRWHMHEDGDGSLVEPDDPRCQ
jgi:hypothetical protein